MCKQHFIFAEILWQFDLRYMRNRVTNMATLHRIALVPALKTYRIGFFFHTAKTPISDRFLCRSDAAPLRS